jgi:3-hydroxybutyryl-CoA dehydrogenase
MGTYIYGVVMQDLNPDLSKERNIPHFFNKIIAEGRLGMKNGKGFFEYKDKEVEKWQRIFRKFSYQIQKIIDKYPFQYLEEDMQIKK